MPSAGFFPSFQIHSKTTANPHMKRTPSDGLYKTSMITQASVSNAIMKQPTASGMPHIMIFHGRSLVLVIRKLNSTTLRSRKTLDKSYAMRKKSRSPTKEILKRVTHQAIPIVTESKKYKLRKRNLRNNLCSTKRYTTNPSTTVVRSKSARSTLDSRVESSRKNNKPRRARATPVETPCTSIPHLYPFCPFSPYAESITCESSMRGGVPSPVAPANAHGGFRAKRKILSASKSLRL